MPNTNPTMSRKTSASYEKEGWEFSRRNCGPSNFSRLEEAGVRLPLWYSEFECCIKHLDSGIKFRFYPCDAFLKREEEKISHGPLYSRFLSYGSPLRQVVDHEFDCAYVGDVFIEKPGDKRQSCYSSWEDIDWKTLHEQIDWITANEKISGLPNSGMFDKKSASRAEKYKKMGLTCQLVNHMERFYNDHNSPDDGNAACYFNLVVTDCGWFASLHQLFGNCYGDGRIREMTMHCNFNQNVIYREIIERETKDFEKNISRVDRCKVYKNMEEIRDDEMCVHFHEAKQFKIRQAYIGGSSSCTVRDARRYSSFTVGKWREACLGARYVPDEKIKSLFDNCGKKIQSIEARTRTRIQVIPIFRHPYNPNPKLSIRTMRIGKAPRAAYICGSDNDVEHAKSCLAEFLGETTQLCRMKSKSETDVGPPSSHDVISDFLRM